MQKLAKRRKKTRLKSTKEKRYQQLIQYKKEALQNQ